MGSDTVVIVLSCCDGNSLVNAVKDVSGSIVGSMSDVKMQFPFVPADAELWIAVVLHFRAVLPRNDVRSVSLC